MNERRMLNVLRRTPYKLSVFQVLRERSVAESADYVQDHLGGAMVFEKLSALWDYAVGAAKGGDGLFLEFGVFKGKSITHFAERLPDVGLHGFDSFEGLAEDWTGYHMPKGTFDLGGELPKVPSNVTLHKGWFDKTLPDFLKENKGKVRFCHVDCDTYESALYVLRAIAKRLVSGSIVVFDEYYGYPNWKNGEFKAWQEVCAENNLQYDYIAFSNMQVAVEIK